MLAVPLSFVAAVMGPLRGQSILVALHVLCYTFAWSMGPPAWLSSLLAGRKRRLLGWEFPWIRASSAPRPRYLQHRSAARILRPLDGESQASASLCARRAPS